jgi:TPP-dependent pyruvate/acetoin dehydrogenase alpha subunit
MDKKTIYKILYFFCKIRETENRIAEEYKNQKIRCPIHLSIGQESISAAMSGIYAKNDYVISNHRCHAHYISKSASLYKMISELYGLKEGCSKGVGGSMHLVDEKNNFIGSTAIVANSIPVGVGYAYGLSLKKKKYRVFIFLGDAATESGTFYESINFAILKKLNITFICENNFYSVYSGLKERQPANRKIFKMISSMGIKSCKIISNNPFVLFKKIKKFLSKNSLSFIEIDTYRYVEHCGPNMDDDLNYRPRKEVAKWLSQDFYKRIFKNNLVAKSFSYYELFKIKKKISNEIDNVFLKAKMSKRSF